MQSKPFSKYLYIDMQIHQYLFSNWFIKNIFAITAAYLIVTLKCYNKFKLHPFEILAHFNINGFFFLICQLINVRRNI